MSAAAQLRQRVECSASLAVESDKFRRAAGIPATLCARSVFVGGRKGSVRVPSLQEASLLALLDHSHLAVREVVVLVLSANPPPAGIGHQLPHLLDTMCRSEMARGAGLGLLLHLAGAGHLLGRRTTDSMLRSLLSTLILGMQTSDSVHGEVAALAMCLVLSSHMGGNGPPVPVDHHLLHCSMRLVLTFAERRFSNELRARASRVLALAVDRHPDAVAGLHNRLISIGFAGLGDPPELADEELVLEALGLLRAVSAARAPIPAWGAAAVVRAAELPAAVPLVLAALRCFFVQRDAYQCFVFNGGIEAVLAACGAIPEPRVTAIASCVLSEPMCRFVVFPEGSLHALVQAMVRCLADPDSPRLHLLQRMDGLFQTHAETLVQEGIVPALLQLHLQGPEPVRAVAASRLAHLHTAWLDTGATQRPLIESIVRSLWAREWAAAAPGMRCLCVMAQAQEWKDATREAPALPAVVAALRHGLAADDRRVMRAACQTIDILGSDSADNMLVAVRAGALPLLARAASSPSERISVLALLALSTLSRLAEWFVESGGGLLRCDLSALVRSIPAALAVVQQRHLPNSVAAVAVASAVSRVCALQTGRAAAGPAGLRLLLVTSASGRAELTRGIRRLCANAPARAAGECGHRLLRIMTVAPSRDIARALLEISRDPAEADTLLTPVALRTLGVLVMWQPDDLLLRTLDQVLTHCRRAKTAAPAAIPDWMLNPLADCCLCACSSETVRPVALSTLRYLTSRWQCSPVMGHMGSLAAAAAGKGAEAADALVVLCNLARMHGVGELAKCRPMQMLLRGLELDCPEAREAAAELAAAVMAHDLGRVGVKRRSPESSPAPLALRRMC